MSFVVAKVVRSGVVFVVEMWLWLALWRRWLVVGVVEKVVGVVEKVVVVVEMRLVQNNDSKRKILPQRSQPGHTNNSL